MLIRRSHGHKKQIDAITPIPRTIAHINCEEEGVA
jgi:hypothetical protein